MDPLTRLDELRLDLAALLLPTECAGCGAPDRELCAACRLSLGGIGDPPRRGDLSGMPCAFGGDYDGVLRAAIVGFKHGGRTGFARILGAVLRPALVAAVAECRGPAAPVLVVAPSRAERVRKRGYHHVELLLGHALRGSGVRALRVHALRAARGRRSQQGLARAERAENAARIDVRRTRTAVLQGRSIVLVDDVVTTGSTLAAARDALESAGARVVACAALCRAAPDDPPGAGREEWKPVRGVE